MLKLMGPLDFCFNQNHYEPLRAYSEVYKIYAMLPKGYGLDRGFQRSLLAS